MTVLLLASGNAKKVEELRRIFAPLMPELEILGLGDVASYPEPAETEPRFEGNALIKARAAVRHTGLPSLADDSGLCVDALNGMPGVLSARWSGVPRAEGGDAANNRLLLAQLAQVSPERRTARFCCAVAFCMPDGLVAVETGTLSGRILNAEQGAGGFGYDPIFAAEGREISNAQLLPEEKDSISHRSRALRAIAPVVQAALS